MLPTSLRAPGAARRAVLVAALAGGVAGCEVAQYTVAVRFPTSAVRTRAAAVEVFVARACDASAVRSGAAPAGALVTRAVSTASSTGMSLGAALPPGAYAVWVRARAADCAVIAAGCAMHTLAAGGRGALDVALEAVSSPPAPGACESPRATCNAGVCAEPGSDAGGPDVFVSTDGGCGAGQARCDDACVPVLSDPMNCGACGNACGALPNAARVGCVGGRCVAAECEPGRGDCDSNPSNGCEADLSSAATCGACARTCTTGQPVCARDSAGRYDCTNGCSSSTTRCMGACVDTQTDEDHCGMCGRVCPAWPANGARLCTGGTCGFRCLTGFHACGGACVSNSSVASCGTSCTPCPAPANGSATCASGTCDVACDPGYVRSGAACVPASMTCGNRALEAGESCDDGNTTAGDGCSASCAVESGVGADTCPAAVIRAAPGGAQYYVGTLASAAGDFALMTCGSGGPDRVYAIQPSASGVLSVGVQPLAMTADVALLRLGSCVTMLPLTCADAGGAGASEAFTLMVTAGTTVYVVVDTASAATAGAYGLALRLM